MKLLTICLIMISSQLFSKNFKEEDFSKDFVEYIQYDCSYCISRILTLPYNEKFNEDVMSEKDKFWYFRGRLDLCNSIIFDWE